MSEDDKQLPETPKEFGVAEITAVFHGIGNALQLPAVAKEQATAQIEIERERTKRYIAGLGALKAEMWHTYGLKWLAAIVFAVILAVLVARGDYVEMGFFGSFLAGAASGFGYARLPKRQTHQVTGE